MSNALHVSDFLRPLSGNVAFSMRSTLENYRKIYFEKASKDMLVTCTYDQRHDRYCFFFKFPSGENDKYPTAIMYDVLLEFDPPNKAARELGSLDNYDIYIYSNSPGFVFTFDYVIKHKIGFPKVLPNSYLSKIAITKPPRIRNTFQIMTAEKTSWICFFHLYRNGYLSKNIAQQIMSDKSTEYFVKSMSTQPQKLQEVKAMQDLLKSEREANKAQNKNKNAAKNYRTAEITPMTDTDLKSNMMFRSGRSLLNPLKFVSKVNERNNKGKTNMFKAQKLKWH